MIATLDVDLSSLKKGATLRDAPAGKAEIVHSCRLGTEGMRKVLEDDV